ncbi:MULTISPECIES: hypothetical protein [unclassified Streptomyces]
MDAAADVNLRLTPDSWGIVSAYDRRVIFVRVRPARRRRSPMLLA